MRVQRLLDNTANNCRTSAHNAYPAESRMRKRLFWFAPLAIGVLIQPRLQGQARPQEPVRDLRIDPMLLVSVKEYRNILETIGPQIYPGWQWNTIPLLL